MIDLDSFLEQISSLKLLYVEDNKEARESALMLLDDLFDNITIAVDGLDGLEKFKENEIDLIITDVSMPEMDGIEMSRAIKEIDKEMSIIVLSAITNISIKEEARDIGIDCFINKPIADIDILFNELEKITNK